MTKLHLHTHTIQRTAAFSGRCFFVGFMLLALLFFTACENKPEDINVWTQKVVNVEEAKNIKTQLSQGGRLRAILTAPLLKRYIVDSQYVEFPKSLAVDFFNDSAVLESKLKSRYGKYFEFLNKVMLRDSVMVYNMKGDTMWTSELWWDQQRQEFYTDKEAVIRKIDGYYKGRKGFRARQDLTDVTLYDLDDSYILHDGSGFPQ